MCDAAIAQQTLPRFIGKKKGNPIRSNSLHLEVLESRDVPSADLVWTAGGDGVHWSDPDNWTEFNNGQLSTIHRAPASTDTLWFGSLGGSGSSSVDDIDVSVDDIIQDSSYTGSLLINTATTLTVTSDFTVYGALEIDGSLDAADVYLIGGSILIEAMLTPTPITCHLLDMVNDASLTLWGSGGGDVVTLSIDSIAMASGTTFEFASSWLDVTVEGGIGSSGSIELSEVSTLRVTGDYSQPAGTLTLPDLSTLAVEGPSPVNLSGHTFITGQAIIMDDTVQIDGAGILEVTERGVLQIEGDLEVRSGTVEFDDIGGSIGIDGNFSVFIGTLNMNVASSGASNSFVVSGSVQLGPEDGVGGPTLNLTQIGTITTPTTFLLIQCPVGEGEGDFNSITAGNSVQAQGWTTINSNDFYFVTL